MTCRNLSVQGTKAAQWKADSGPFFKPGLYQKIIHDLDLGGTFSGLVKKRKISFSLLR